MRLSNNEITAYATIRLLLSQILYIIISIFISISCKLSLLKHVQLENLFNSSENINHVTNVSQEHREGVHVAKRKGKCYSKRKSWA